MRHFFSLCLPLSMGTTMALAAPNASETSRAPQSFFLAANPHVPLAVVRDGAVHEAIRSDAKHCGNPKRWSTVGSKWRAIDGWGQVVGERSIVAVDKYDVTGCNEASFAGSNLQNDRTLLYVSTDSAWRPPPSAQWLPGKGTMRAFDRLLNRVGRGIKSTYETCNEVPIAARYFRVRNERGADDHYAVGGRDGGYLVAALTKRGWVVTTEWHTEEKPRDRKGWCHRPVGVFDMNGDGLPEIIVRQSSGDGWEERVLTPKMLEHRLKWTVVATSPGGSTA